MIRHRFSGTFLTITFLTIFSISGYAEIPSYVSYQGRLTDDAGQSVTGSKLMKFKIYGSSTGDDSLWSSGFRAVTIADGLFDYKLGSNVALPVDLFTGNDPRYLGITVDTDAEISPRTQLIAVPYAHHAAISDSARMAPVIPDDDWVTDGYDVYRESGNVGIWTDSPNAPLVVGDDLGPVSGKHVVIGDNDIGAYPGLIVGRSNDYYGWLSYIVDDDYLTIGSKENSSIYSNALTARKGNVAVGALPQDSIDLYVEATGSTSGTNVHTGICSKMKDNNSGAHVYGGKFYSSGGIGAYGIHGEANGGLFHSVGGVFNGDQNGIEAYGADYSAELYGDVLMWDDLQVFGNVSKSSGSFKIDHPLDPENRFLIHSFVESPDMMNIYNGNIVTDADGFAQVTLPDYFEALNMEFRYQLTVIGQFAQAIINEEISGNRFSIRTDKPNVKVSWLVTGIRQDPWANDHRIQVEVEKSEEEKGYYIAPESYGFGKDKKIGYEDCLFKDRISRSISSEKY